jgi:hypothetical protein
VAGRERATVGAGVIGGPIEAVGAMRRSRDCDAIVWGRGERVCMAA